MYKLVLVGKPEEILYFLNLAINWRYAWYIQTDLTELHVVEGVPWLQLAQRPIARFCVMCYELSGFSSLTS